MVAAGFRSSPAVADSASSWFQLAVRRRGPLGVGFVSARCARRSHPAFSAASNATSFRSTRAGSIWSRSAFRLDVKRAAPATKIEIVIGNGCATACQMIVSLYCAMPSGTATTFACEIATSCPAADRIVCGASCTSCNDTSKVQLRLTGQRKVSPNRQPRRGRSAAFVRASRRSPHG